MKKKAKIILVVIALLGAAGWALAFMTANQGIYTFYTSTTFPGTGAFELNTIYTTNGAGQTKAFSDITTTSGAAVVRTLELSSTI